MQVDPTDRIFQNIPTTNKVRSLSIKFMYQNSNTALQIKHIDDLIYIYIRLLETQLPPLQPPLSWSYV